MYFERVQNYLAQNRDYKQYRASQYIILMMWIRNIYVQSLFSAWEQLSKDGIQQRQDLVFIHEIVELQGMQRMEMSQCKKHLNNSWNNPEHSQSFG